MHKEQLLVRFHLLRDIRANSMMVSALSGLRIKNASRWCGRRCEK